MTQEMYPYEKIPDDLPWSDRICCKDMQRHLTLNATCENHGYNCPDRGIAYGNKRYMLRAPNANYLISYCPWCGGRLNNEIKYPKKIDRKDFDQLLCHDCAKPLKDVMCKTCCECIECFTGPCVGKYRWSIQESAGLFVVYGNTSVYAPKHTDPIEEELSLLQRILRWFS